ncbi:MAG: hypothetical protein HC769_20245 [Cyanobacteria bacterium CRU_2_1]|nr:hypothetical protein [Cyanobacteria bacterium RU_5_0]NJR60947.1 hypothetical protein [Cyanobacteria bacterium CRU_2_1]
MAIAIQHSSFNGWSAAIAPSFPLADRHRCFHQPIGLVGDRIDWLYGYCAWSDWNFLITA